ncbi:DUF3043 domain-containing protein [Actinomyces trachealis]|uniref:DUF3043 domain-containing protein n=1 Tax=Actinomyces trachealis TaxID=2763540 RepID=UPI001FCFDBD6|nr:DUF3043 domain-containing protein [Actinomyces trachealis]
MSWFKRESTEGTAKMSSPVKDTASKSGGKGRPTPKRRDAEAAGLRPVVPADRKAAKRSAREKRDAAWRQQQDALQTGDERHYPAKDRGPIKRYMRDYIDARYSIGEIFVPASFLLLAGSLALSFVKQAGALNVFVLLSMYLIFIAAILDATWCYFRLRSKLFEKFGRDKVRAQGSVFWYTFARCFNLRRWRSPKAMVARGEYPN